MFTLSLGGKDPMKVSVQSDSHIFSPLLQSFQSSDEENEDLKKDRPRPRVNSGNSRKQANVQETEEDGKTENQKSERQRKISEYNSGNESDIPKRNYRKVTRLSSGQIVSLMDSAYYCYCASQDTWVLYRWCLLLIQGYFCVVENYAEKAELSKCSWYLRRKLGVTMQFQS